MIEWVRTGVLILGLAAFAGAQLDDAEEEHYFMNAVVAIRLERDSLKVEFAAPEEDMVNTVRIFPSDNVDAAPYRLYERKTEAYLQERLPIEINRRRVYLKVIQWKPGGRGRDDGFDSLSIYSPQKITLAAKLPQRRDSLDITVNLWTERSDAGQTRVRFELFQGDRILERRWSGREKRQRFYISEKALKRLKRLPPPPPKPLTEFGED